MYLFFLEVTFHMVIICKITDTLATLGERFRETIKKLRKADKKKQSKHRNILSFQVSVTIQNHRL